MIFIDTRSIITTIASCTYSAGAFWELASPLRWNTDRSMFTRQTHAHRRFKDYHSKSWGRRNGIDMEVRLYNGANKEKKIFFGISTGILIYLP